MQGIVHFFGIGATSREGVLYEPIRVFSKSHAKGATSLGPKSTTTTVELSSSSLTGHTSDVVVHGSAATVGQAS